MIFGHLKSGVQTQGHHMSSWSIGESEWPIHPLTWKIIKNILAIYLILFGYLFQDISSKIIFHPWRSWTFLRIFNGSLQPLFLMVKTHVFPVMIFPRKSTEIWPGSSWRTAPRALRWSSAESCAPSGPRPWSSGLGRPFLGKGSPIAGWLKKWKIPISKWYPMDIYGLYIPIDVYYMVYNGIYLYIWSLKAGPLPGFAESMICFDVANVRNPRLFGNPYVSFWKGDLLEQFPKADLDRLNQSWLSWDVRVSESQRDEKSSQTCRCNSDFSNSQLAHSPPFVVPFGRHGVACFGSRLDTSPPQFLGFFPYFVNLNPWIVEVPLPSWRHNQSPVCPNDQGS